MDLSCLGDVEKLYYERKGKFEPDDWKKFVPDRTEVDKLKQRLIKVRTDAESNSLPESNAIPELEPDDPAIGQRVRSQSA